MEFLQTTLCYLEKDGAYLMLHRIKKKNDVNHDKWVGVGGKFEPGEDALACALREVREETGCEVEIAGLCDVVDSVVEGIHAVLIDFNARWVSGEPMAGDDAAEAMFVKLEDVKRYVTWGETLRVIALSAQQMGVSPA